MAKLKRANQFDIDEVFRQLRTNIEFMKIEEDLSVINITSTTKNEGKTTVAVNLAKMFAAKYQKVLLIDCDLRNPSVHRSMELSNSSGLSDILAELKLDTIMDISASPAVKRVKYNPEDNELTVLTSGSRVPNPSEILSSRRFKRFLELARSQYSYIIIDCPPVGLVSDAIPIANLSDGTLFVASAKENHKKAVRMIINDLIRNGANVLGLVLNRVDSTSQSYGYGYYYGNEKTEKKSWLRGNKQ